MKLFSHVIVTPNSQPQIATILLAIKKKIFYLIRNREKIHKIPTHPDPNDKQSTR